VSLSSVMPNEVPDLFAGQSIVLLARYQGSGRGTVRVSGRTAHGAATWTHAAVFPERSSDNAFIPRLWATQRIGWLSAQRHAQGPSPEVDAEIKELGERYGIPTELTSYLVREPAVTALGGGQPLPAPAMATNGAVAVGSAAPSREARFDQAKAATAMRASRSLAAADSVAEASARMQGSAVARRAGDRMFERQSDTSAWVDRGYREGMRRLRIQAYSPAYFELLGTMPELRAAFALGDHVIVAGRAVAIEVTTDAGAAAALAPADRTALRENW